MTIKNKKISGKMMAILGIVIVALGGGFLFHSLTTAQASEEMQAGAPQAMPVEAGIVMPEKIQIWKNFSGHVVAVDVAEIRPQVSGRITELRFEDGQHVKKGDTLIVIDPRPYQAALNQAKAGLEAAKTQADLADKEYYRATKLIDTEAISQSLLDRRTDNRRTALAAVQGAKALVESARINLDYAYVKAPISGKISRAEITEGNVVQTGSSAPLLTTIVADEKVYVDFEVDERTYLNSIGSVNDASNIPVRLKLLSADLEYNGVVHSFDNRIDRASGTIRARAIFDNNDGTLLPGMSVSVLMGGTGDEEKILITERAIGTDQDRKFVYVINDKNTAEYREVKLGESINGMRVVLSGLKEGETVITDGLVRIRPNMPVTPQLKEAEVLEKEEAPLPDVTAVESAEQEIAEKE